MNHETGKKKVSAGFSRLLHVFMFAIFLVVIVLIGGLVGVVFAVGMSFGQSKTDDKNQSLFHIRDSLYLQVQCYFKHTSIIHICIVSLLIISGDILYALTTLSTMRQVYEIKRTGSER